VDRPVADEGVSASRASKIGNWHLLSIVIVVPVLGVHT
jgi:hypothetical protein